MWTLEVRTVAPDGQLHHVLIWDGKRLALERQGEVAGVNSYYWVAGRGIQVGGAGNPAPYGWFIGPQVISLGPAAYEIP